MDKNFNFSEAYAPIFYSDKRYFIISGGRASGKSTNLAAYFVMMLTGDKYFRGIISRYTQRSLSHSIYRDIEDIITAWDLNQYIRKKGDEIVYTPNGNSIITHSFRIGDNSQVAKGKGISNPTHLLIDEAQELPSEEEYIKTIDSFRTKDVDTQIFLVFNPGSKRHWIYTRFFLSEGVPNPKWLQDHCFIHTTFKDTEQHLDPKKVAEWERMKDIDPDYYNHHILGMWSNGEEGKIFDGWESGYCTDEDAPIMYGLDFGYAGDPAACCEVRKRNGKMWLKELIYHKNLTNPDLYNLLIQKGVPTDATIIADAAEPKSIEELRRLGFKNIKACYKGPDSIRNGINKIKEYQVYLTPESEHLWKEYDLYSWKKDTDTPIDSYNHLIDAIRYTQSKEITKPVTTYSRASYEQYKNSKDPDMEIYKTIN